MLKMTGIKLELVSDNYMDLFIEEGIRGGFSYIAKRYSKANHKYMKDYDSSEESIFIIYLDANNLHGWEMSKYFPYGGLEWLSQEGIKNLM